MKNILLIAIVLLGLQLNAQDLFNDGNFETVEMGDDFFTTKLQLDDDADKNKQIVTDNIELYNKLVKAFNEKDYETSFYYAEEVFGRNIKEKMQFKVYFKRSNYMNELHQNHKVMYFLTLLYKDEPDIGDAQGEFEYIMENCSPERKKYVKQKAEEFNATTSKKQIKIDY